MSEVDARRYVQLIQRMATGLIATRAGILAMQQTFVLDPSAELEARILKIEDDSLTAKADMLRLIEAACAPKYTGSNLKATCTTGFKVILPKSLGVRSTPGVEAVSDEEFVRRIQGGTEGRKLAALGIAGIDRGVQLGHMGALGFPIVLLAPLLIKGTIAVVVAVSLSAIAKELSPSRMKEAENAAARIQTIRDATAAVAAGLLPPEQLETINKALKNTQEAGGGGGGGSKPGILDWILANPDKAIAAAILFAIGVYAAPILIPKLAQSARAVQAARSAA